MNAVLDDDKERQALRLQIADATGTVSALTQEVARLNTRLVLAKAHARHLNDEYALKFGAYP